MIIEYFLTIQSQLKIFHFQTTSYAQHKALGKAYDEIEELMDTFIEVFAGGDRSILDFDKITMNCQGINSISPITFMNNLTTYINGPLASAIPPNRGDLENIRAEILGVVNRTLYLLNLK
jgi:Family of unknown function (DUF5856)